MASLPSIMLNDCFLAVLPDMVPVTVPNWQQAGRWFDLCSDGSPGGTWAEVQDTHAAEHLQDIVTNDCDSGLFVDVGPSACVQATPAALEFLSWLIDDYHRR